MALRQLAYVVAVASYFHVACAEDQASMHTFTVSAGTLNNDHTATIIVDGNMFLNDLQEIVAPNGTDVRLFLGNTTREMRTPLPGGDQGFPVGALVVATPGCGQLVPAQVNVFYFPGNSAHDGPCGSASELDKFLAGLPNGTPVAMTTLYNQKGWEGFRCPDDVINFQKSVKTLGGKYPGSLGTKTSAPDGGDYKSAYLLVGSVGGDAAVEKYCTSEFETSADLSGSPSPHCGVPFNGAWIEKVNVTLPSCSAKVLV